jgi:hypothetical protein
MKLNTYHFGGVGGRRTEPRSAIETLRYQNWLYIFRRRGGSGEAGQRGEEEWDITKHSGHYDMADREGPTWPAAIPWPKIANENCR